MALTLAVSAMLNIMALAFASLSDSISTKFFLIYAVSQSFTDGTIMGNMTVLEFYPLKIGIDFVLKDMLTLFLRSVFDKSSKPLSEDPSNVVFGDSTPFMVHYKTWRYSHTLCALVVQTLKSAEILSA